MKLFDSLQNTATKIGFEVAKKKPEILIGVGITTAIIGCVHACKATIKASEILTEAEKEKEMIEAAEEYSGGEYTSEDKSKDLKIVRTKCVVNIAKNYILPVTLGAISIMCIYNSHAEMKARCIQLVGAYNVLNKSLNYFYKNVSEEYGEDAARKLFHGIKSEEIEVKETDENGNEITTVKKVDVIDDDCGNNPYSFIFARETSNAWQNEQYYNKSWVESSQQEAQRILDDRAYEMEKRGYPKEKAKFLLNDALTLLQMGNTDVGCAAGWKGGSTIDFRAVDIYARGIREGRDARILEPAIALNFNCDGLVMDDMPSNADHLKYLKDYGKNA